MSWIAPYGRITRVLPLTIMFNPRENLDLDLQSVGYAMMHTTWLARISHYTIFIDAFLWFIIFNSFSNILGAIVLMLMTYQSSKIGEQAFTLTFLLLGVAFYSLSLLVGNAIGWEGAWLISISVLMLTAVIRLIGHSTEPAPPMMLDASDQFVPVKPRTMNWKLAIMPIYGYVAEFASGLPNRLFTVHVNFIYQQVLRLKPKQTMSWSSINERAFRIFRSGYKSDERMGDYYNQVNEKHPLNEAV